MTDESCRVGGVRDPREAMDQSAALTAASSVGDGPEDIANFTEGVRTHRFLAAFRLSPSCFLLPVAMILLRGICCFFCVLTLLFLG